MTLHVDSIPIPRGLFRVVAVQAVGPTSLRVSFDDGVSGELDMDTYLQWDGVFAALKADPTLFAQVFADPESGTVAWPGNIDIDSEALHARIVWDRAQHT